MHPIGFTMSKQHTCILQSTAVLRIDYIAIALQPSYLVHIHDCGCSTTVIELIVVLNHFMQVIPVCPSDIFYLHL